MPATTVRGISRRATRVICQQYTNAMVRPITRVAVTSVKLEMVCEARVFAFSALTLTRWTRFGLPLLSISVIYMLIVVLKAAFFRIIAKFSVLSRKQNSFVTIMIRLRIENTKRRIDKT